MYLEVFPSSGAPILLGALPSLDVFMSLVDYLFSGNVNIHRSCHFPRGTYHPSNVWKQRGNYFLGALFIREDILTLLIHICGDHMVLLV